MKKFNKKLAQLRKDMKGLNRKAAEHIGVSPTYISIILSGKRENIDILVKIQDFAAAEKKRRTEQFKKFLES